MTAYFVTGAGTEIGKTYVSAALLAAARARGDAVCALKPLMSGFDRPSMKHSDAGVLLSACGREPNAENIAEICLHAFEAPLAPNMAARIEGAELNDDAIIQFVKSRIASPPALTLVEGAGGVMSPATDTLLQLDLMRSLGLPAILVTSNYLGAISHTLTALEALKQAGVAIACVVVSQPDSQAQPPQALIEELRRWRREPMISAAYGDDPIKLGARLLETLEAGPGETQRLDLRGYRCPVPVIRLEAALRDLSDGAQVTVFADDPVAAIDIPHYCREAGHGVERLQDVENACVFQVTRSPKPA